ncbi:MAG: hypothetical protein N2487_05900, partial [Verrucomicrobiae bacterium]|nr:hypothetical protein [Verrucomicrobiae bacterium]
FKIAVVSSNNISGKYLLVAAAPSKSDTNRLSELISAEKILSLNLSDYAAIIWNDRLPEGASAENLRNYLLAGGSLVMFACSSTGSFEGISFSEMQEAGQDKFWKITKWHESDGPLARTEEGFSLPLNELQIFKRQVLNGQGSSIAFFEEGSAFIKRKVVGKGNLLMIGSSPEPSWSNLGEGIVLVPLVQRIIMAGGKRLSQSGMLTCGETPPLRSGDQILPVDGKDFKTDAGVYKFNGRLYAFNHPY